jgi:hypothetical protein
MEIIDFGERGCVNALNTVSRDIDALSRIEIKIPYSPGIDDSYGR